MPKSFNDRASHTNKMDTSNNNNNNNNNNKVPASCNQSLSETTLEQKINVPDNSSGANFPNPLMSVYIVYNFDAHPWPRTRF